MRALRGLALLAALLAPLPAWATIALVNSSAGSNATSTPENSRSAPAISVTTGNLLVVTCRFATNTAPVATASVSDTAGNTFTSVTSVGDDSLDLIQIFYAKNVIGNAADVVTCNYAGSGSAGGGATFDATLVLQYSGADTASPLDASATGTASSASSVASGTFTTTSANEVLVAAFSENALSDTFSPGAGYTIEVKDSSPFSGMEDQIVSSIQTNVTASASSTTGSTPWEIVVATFKAAGGAGPSCPHTLALTGAGC